MSDAYIGEIRAVAFNFVPLGWLACDGSLLSIQGNAPLFALLGTAYGGDGVTNFALPDLRGRSIVGVNGAPVKVNPSLSSIPLGTTAGSENATITQAQMPAHTHAATASQPAYNGNGTTTNPSGALPAAPVGSLNKGLPAWVPTSTGSNANLAPATVTVQTSGQGQPLPLRNPYTSLLYIICSQGIYPSRS